MFFVGIDLAWSEKNLSGVAVFEGDEETMQFRCANILRADSEILDFIEGSVGEKPALIAIDAPLIVPNEDGRRIADAQVCDFFGKYNAGAYPASRKLFLQWGETIRGEELSRKLESLGFKQDPYFTKNDKGSRKFFEVYPHPAMVVIFNLREIIRYKKKKGRPYETVWDEFQRYQKCLKKLETDFPELRISSELIEKNIIGLKGKALKNIEDQLDAVFCAYIAYYAWAYREKCTVFGNLNEGYILSPIFPEMQFRLQRNQIRI